MEREGEERPIKVLVITLGGDRQKMIEKMFESTPNRGMVQLSFSPGINSRRFNSRIESIRLAHEVGLVPDVEMDALNKAEAEMNAKYKTDGLFNCLKDIPITLDREGSARDIEKHYSVEFWQKAKGINRGKSVLACLFAHLRAMKLFTENNMDIILEDNVRAPVETLLDRIQQLRRDFESQESMSHLRYYGWLGSKANIRWIYHSYQHRYADTMDVIPLPTGKDIEEDINTGRYNLDMTTEMNPSDGTDTDRPSEKYSMPGGTPVWGAYAYWISKEAYAAVVDRLRHDVGSILWKGKRNRFYTVKPVDKILPRIVSQRFGREAICMARRPCFFRAPMLTSKIHAKWDVDFCKSTELQLNDQSVNWNDLFLSGNEAVIVNLYMSTGVWVNESDVQAADSKN